MTEDIEPEALKAREEWGAGVRGGATLDASVTNAASVLSIAISLKRIADAVSGSPQHLGMVDGIMHAIEQGLIAGRNG